MLIVRGKLNDTLQSLGDAYASHNGNQLSWATADARLEEPEPEVDLDVLFASASQNETVKDIGAFWNDAVEKTSNVPTNPDVISFEEARKLVNAWQNHAGPIDRPR